MPKGQQAKQAAVQRLLNAIVDGVGDESGLAIYAPGIDLRTKCEDIRKGPAGQLIGWEFKGQPNGNRVPVILHYAEQQYSRVDRDNSPREERFFDVAANGARFSISPK